MNAERFKTMCDRLMAGATASGDPDVPTFVGNAQRMRLMLSTVANATPIKGETLMQFNDRLRAIAAAGIEQ